MSDPSTTTEAIPALATELASCWAEAIEPEVRGRDRRERDAALSFAHAALDLAMEMWWQKGDPAAPEFTEWELPWRKFGGDNPGTTYLSAPVDPAGQYRIHGRLTDSVYVGVQAYTKGPGYNAPSANLGDGDLDLADDTIDLVVGGADPGDGRPWLPLVADDYLVMVRAYLADPHGQGPDLRIERVDGATTPLSPEARSAAATAFLREAVLSTVSVTDVLRQAGTNAYPAPDAPVHAPRYTGALFPTLDNVYDGCWMALAEGEALVVEGRLPRARYSSFVFYDRWFITPDHRRVRCFRNDRDLVADPDGSYVVHVGPTDTGHPNWIDTDGLREGIFAIRCLLPEERSLPDLSVRRVEDLGS